MRLLVLVFLAFILMAAAVPPATPPPDRAPDKVIDQAIERSLKTRLNRSKLKHDGLSFAVKNGVVEWQGEVAVPQRKGTATRMAKAAGATQVVNRIRIKPGASQASKKSSTNGGSTPRVVTVVKTPRP